MPPGTLAASFLRLSFLLKNFIVPRTVVAMPMADGGEAGRVRWDASARKRWGSVN
jgi:hypothetical protein